MIRGLLALEGHAAEDVQVSDRDVDRVVRGVEAGRPLEQVFPRLLTISSATSGSGTSVTVHFTKKSGAPVHYVSADDPTEAAAVRQIDLQRKYHLSASELAAALGLTSNRGTALRRHLDIDRDGDCRHVFEFGSQKHVRFSDNAYRRMKEALDAGVDMDAVWAQQGWGGRRQRTA